VIRRDACTLVSRRPDRGPRGGRWEFPGGKVEPGEAEADALRREIAEELGCRVEVGLLLVRHRHAYPDGEVELAFYACTLPAGEEPRCVGVAQLDWAPFGTLERYDFLEADLAVLPLLDGGPGAPRG
jgi:8-oxo-dGTP diphosphatase